MEFRNFEIILEEDADGNGWHACSPAWEDLGAATCGETREESIDNIKEVLAMIVAEIRDVSITPEEVAERGGFPQSPCQRRQRFPVRSHRDLTDSRAGHRLICP